MRPIAVLALFVGSTSLSVQYKEKTDTNNNDREQNEYRNTEVPFLKHSFNFSHSFSTSRPFSSSTFYNAFSIRNATGFKDGMIRSY